ncbi:MAG TPA: AI-2E family transporter [Paenibacillus sp.]|uniref:AI-2E family transporter n=1 Tax=Paenibacillus sp. TaxID=58172 RepID=UPI0028CFD940|nr:AI-2E family transporter [Paenibacillus sp.]HUC91356.1 AI-2E family transporter [Paenibacillus sp.]
MEKWTNSRLFTGLVYSILALLALFLLLQLKPVIANVYDFLKTVLAPFLIAMIISYVLNPIVTMLAARRMPRSVAVLLIYAVFASAVTVVLMNVIPMFVLQMAELNAHAPELTMRAQSFMNDLNNSSFLPESIRKGLTHSLYEAEKKLYDAAFAFVNNIGAMLNVVFVAFIIPFLAFYILKDFDAFERAVIAYVPRAHRQSTVRLFKDIDEALGNYIRGQFIVCVLVGVLAYIGYWAIGLPYPLLLAGIVGITNVIPYLGPFIGAAPALVVASTVSVKMMLLVAAVNMACQIIEGNIISPQVVGRTLHMHPLTIIFVLLVGGQLAGLVGMILAVPIFAAVKVVLQHLFAYWIRRKTI